MNRIVYGHRIRDIILELLPDRREEAVSVQQLRELIPPEYEFHPSAIFQTLTKLVRWGLVRRELKRRAGIDCLGRPKDLNVYWRA